MNNILNQPLGLETFKFLFSKFLYIFFNIRVKYRKNYLNTNDLRKTKEIIKRGDLILVGDFKTISGLFMGKYFTHSLLYIGKGKCIHASGKGVQKILLKKVFKIYDTLTILRPEKEYDSKETVEKCIKFAKKQVGKRYDYFLKNSEDKFYCTNLVNLSFKRAGFNTGVNTNRKSYWLINRLKRAFKADYFLQANFRIIHSLNIINK